MPQPNPNGWKNTVIGILTSVVLTGFAAWITFGGAPSKAEVTEEIQLQQAPIVQRIEQNTKAVEKLEQKTEATRKAVNDNGRKIDVLLDRSAPR